MLNLQASNLHQTSQPLDLKPSNRLRYLMSYYKTALPAILRPNKLEPSKVKDVYTSHFSFSEADKRAWFDLFDLSYEQHKTLPFTYVTTSATLKFMRLLSDLGVNFKYVRHMSSNIRINPNNKVNQPNQTYSYDVQLSNIICLKKNRVMLELSAQIQDEQGQVCAEHKEYFMAAKFKDSQLECLQTREVQSVKPTAFVSLKGEAKKVNVPLNMGVAYGRVSGDMNIVHTTMLAARMMGYKKPFIQGFCTVNLMLSELAKQGKGNLETISCSFTRPIFVGDELTLYQDEGKFELRNAQEKTVAHGQFKQTASQA